MKNILLTTIFFSYLIVVNGQDIMSNTAGISASLSPVYASWESESFFLSDLASLEPNGYGINIEVAYGVNQNITAALGFSSLNFNHNEDWQKYSFSLVNVLGRYNFGATLSAFRPFLEAGLSSISNKVDPVSLDNSGSYELRNSGLGFVGGGGLDYFLKSNLCIDLKAQFHSGNFSTSELDGLELEIDENVDYFIFNINLGIKYFFD